MASGAKGGSRPAGSPDQFEQCVIWDGGHHSALAVVLAAAMYADTGIATNSARVTWSGRWARWLAKPCRRLFAGSPMPELQVPGLRQPDFESPSLVPLSS